MDHTEDAAVEQPAERRREPVFNLPGVVIAAIAICAGIHLVRLYVLTLDQDIGLLVRAAFIPVRYSGAYAIDIYAFTSPVSYSLLHAGVAHLVINMVWLAAFGSPLANRLGAARFVLFWIATSMAAALLHFVLHSSDQSPLIGASGAISGMMGAAARFAFQVDRSAGKPIFGGPILPVSMVLRMRGVILFLAVWMVLNLVTGIYSRVPNQDGGGIAWEAHVGGFLLGFFAIGLFVRRIDDSLQA